MDELHLKNQKLYRYLKSLGSIAVAFSGGVDSSFLAKCASEALGHNMIAVTARSCSFPARELHESVEFADKHNIHQIIIDSGELDVDGYSENTADRCYYCKKELFRRIIKLADSKNIKYTAEGSNMDDLDDYRPGLKAVKELGVVSPLRYAGLNKDDIRKLSKEMGLNTWDKPSFACLASRIPYGQRITAEKLSVVDKAEQFLINMGFKQVRVRHYGNTARIELPAEDIPRVLDGGNREDICTELMKLGFTYVTLDLNGYVSGSMNKEIAAAGKQ